MLMERFADAGAALASVGARACARHLQQEALSPGRPDGGGALRVLVRQLREHAGVLPSDGGVLGLRGRDAADALAEAAARCTHVGSAKVSNLFMLPCTETSRGLWQEMPGASSQEPDTCVCRCSRNLLEAAVGRGGQQPHLAYARERSHRKLAWSSGSVASFSARLYCFTASFHCAHGVRQSSAKSQHRHIHHLVY